MWKKKRWIAVLCALFLPLAPLPTGLESFDTALPLTVHGAGKVTLPQKLTLTVGKPKKLTLKGTKSPKIKWRSSKPGIVKVKGSKNICTLIPRKAGSAYVTASYRGKSYRCKVIVRKAESSVSGPGITIKKTESLNYNYIDLIFDAPKNYYIYTLYRSSSRNGNYHLVDTIELNHWTFFNGLKYSMGAKKKASLIDDGSHEYRIRDESVSVKKTYYYKIAVSTPDYWISETQKTYYSKPVSARSRLRTPLISRGYALSGNQVKLQWQPSEKAQGYCIYRKDSGVWKRIGKVNGTTSYIDTTVQANKTYTYRVRSYLNSGSKTFFSEYCPACPVSTKSPTVPGTYSPGSVYGPSLNTTELQEVHRVVQFFADSYIDSRMSDFEKIWTVYDYLRGTCTYAWKGWQYNRANTAWGALIYGEAQCSGYARATKALCDAIGIPCYYVHANSRSANPSHQWNEVCINGKWYILDTQGGFFLVSGNTYRSRSGMDWDTTGLPECKSDYRDS